MHIGEFLSTFRRPVGVSAGGFQSFKREATRFLKDGVLYQRGGRGGAGMLL